jgi:hypothetical protein
MKRQHATHDQCGDEETGEPGFHLKAVLVVLGLAAKQKAVQRGSPSCG